MNKNSEFRIPNSVLRIPHWKTFWAVLIIFVISWMVYANSMTSPFHLDDYHSIKGNPHIRELKNIPTFFKDPGMFSRDLDMRMYRPVLLVSYALNYALGGVEPAGFRFVNLIFHAINGMLLFLILYHLIFLLGWPGEGSKKGNLFSPFPLSLIAAIIFIVHPVQTQSINYISNRSIILASFFFLLSFYLYVRLSVIGYRLSVYYLLSLVSYALGLLTKEVVVVLPALFLIYDYLFKEKVSGMWNADCGLRNTEQKLLTPNSELRTRKQYLTPYTLHLVRRHLPFWLITLAYLGLRKVVMEETGVMAAIKGSSGVDIVSPYAYLFTQLKVTVYYLKVLFLPTNLSTLPYVGGTSSFWEPLVVVSFFIILFLLFTAFFTMRKHTIVAFGLFWFFVNIFPTMVLPLQITVNFNRIYLALAGYAIIFSILLGRFSLLLKALFSLKRERLVFFGVAGSILLVLTGVTIARNSVWRNEVILWEEAVERSPGSPMAMDQLGRAYLMAGRVDEAMETFKRTLSIDDRYVWSYYNLAMAYERKGEINKAIKEHKKAIKLAPLFEQAHNKLGLIYYRLDFIDEAIDEFKKTVEIAPGFSMAHYNLGLAYDRKGMVKEAMREFDLAGWKAPEGSTSAAIHTSERYKMRRRRLEMARKDIETAPPEGIVLPVKPSLTPEERIMEHFQRGVHLYQRKSYDEAIKEFEAVLSIDPDIAEVHNNLGFLYLDKGEPDRAIEEQKRALQIDPEFANAYYGLALALEKKDRREEAVKAWQDYLKRAESNTIWWNKAKERLERLSIKSKTSYKVRMSD